MHTHTANCKFRQEPVSLLILMERFYQGRIISHLWHTPGERRAHAFVEAVWPTSFDKQTQTLDIQIQIQIQIQTFVEEPERELLVLLKAKWVQTRILLLHVLTHSTHYMLFRLLDRGLLQAKI